jgi:hypothetical protein
MGNNHYRRLRSFLEENGYAYQRKNTKGYEIWKNPASTRHSLVSVQNAMSDLDATHLIHNISKDLGLTTKKDGGKRNAETVKQRRARLRKQEQERIERAQRELDELVVQRDAEIQHAKAVRSEADQALDGVGAYLTHAEVIDLTRRIEERAAEIAEWQKMLHVAGSGQNRYYA